MVTLVDSFPYLAQLAKQALTASHEKTPTFRRSLDFVTKDFPLAKAGKGDAIGLIGEPGDVVPAFVLAADNTVLTSSDAGKSNLPPGPYRFCATINILNSAGTGINPLLEKTLAASPGVLSLSLSPTITPDLSFTVPEVRGSASEILPVYPGKTGKGIIVGIIDYGFDFAHPNFLNPDGTSRLIALWDQNSQASNTGFDLVLDDLKPTGNWNKGAGAYSSSYIYTPSGQFNSGAHVWPASPAKALNDFIKSADPYSGTGNYDPHSNYFLARAVADDNGAHGTHVADIAVGNGAATGHPGVAPEADIVFVQLRPPNSQKDGPPDLATVLDAVHFIVRLAEVKGKPAVINLCVNANTGAHDNSDLYSPMLDKYTLGTSGTGTTKQVPIVVSAGNQFLLARDQVGLPNDPISGAGAFKRAYRETLAHRLTLAPNVPNKFMWLVRKNDNTINTLQLYYRVNGADDVSISVTGRLLDATAATQAPGSGGNPVDIKSSDASTTVGTIYVRDALPGNNLPRLVKIEIRPNDFPTTAPHILDDFLVQVAVTSATGRNIHAFVERDGMNTSNQSGLAIPDAELEAKLNGCTLGTLSCGAETVVVGAYFAIDKAGSGAQVAEFSSGGPAVDYAKLDDASFGAGNLQPTMSAPGMIVLAARSKGGRPIANPTRDFAIFMSGTSMAAPHVTGAIALMLHKTGTATPAQLKAALKAAARRDPHLYDSNKMWDNRLGSGRLDVKAAMDKI